LKVATELHEPMYICHLLRGATQAIKNGAKPPAGGLFKAVELVHARPWKARQLGDSTFDYDPDWAPAASAAIDVLGALASQRIGFEDRTDDAWAYIRAAVQDRSDQGGVSMDDPLTRAINRHCTQALGVAIAFLDWEHETAGRARDDAFALLDETLLLTGDDGLQHRAVIVARLGFFSARHDQWLDEAAEVLFGDAAPDGLAQPTLQLAIQWSRPNRMLLERFRSNVHAAVKAGAQNALNHVLIANLWAVPGYSVDELLGFLSCEPGLLSQAGGQLGRLARGADEPDALEGAVTTWRAALDAGRVGELAGFAWMAEIEALDDDVWLELTWRTMQATPGRVEWGHTLPKRTAAMEPTAMTLAVLDHVVRFESNQWDAHMTGPLAAGHWNRAGALAGTDEYTRLQAALLERGHL
jgi:hypothetical protein